MSTGIEVDVSRAIKKLQKAEMAFERADMLKFIGQTFLFWLNENFRQRGAVFQSGGWPPLRPNTLANPRRGGSGSQPLRSGGKLAASFTIGRQYNVFDLAHDSVTVGTEVPYAVFHQKGTKKNYPIRPRHKRMLFFWTVAGNASPFAGRGNTFAKEVIHPGLPVRRLVPNQSKAEKIAADAANEFISRRLRGAS